MNTTNEHHFRLRVTSEHNHVENIAHAYRTCGLEPPNRATDLRQLLADEPRPDDLAIQLATEALTVDNLEEWTEAAIERIRRAQAVETLHRAVIGLGAGAAKRNRATLVRDAVADLSKPFAAAVKQLTTAAHRLPATNQPLDIEAVVETDTTAERRQAQQALAVMAAVGSVHTMPPAPALAPRTRDALTVVDVPEVPLAQVDRLSRQVLNPDATRDHVRRFLKHAEKHGIDRALIGVARGEYGPDVVLSLAADGAELRARIERATRAASGQVIDSWGYKQPATA